MTAFLAYIFLFSLFFFLILYLVSYSEPVENWTQRFPNMEHDPEVFYKAVEDVIKERQMPDISIEQTTLAQGGALSHNRLYLKIKRGKYTFHICAAPWGTEYFFSWWLSKYVNLLIKLPRIGKYIEKMSDSATFYELDTDTMFKQSVPDAVLSVIARITDSKGVRVTTEREQPVSFRETEA